MGASIARCAETLRVDHERPASSVADDDAVVDREGVGRQAGDVPAANLHRVAERRVQRKVVRARDALRLHLNAPAPTQTSRSVSLLNPGERVPGHRASSWERPTAVSVEPETRYGK